MTHTYQPNDSPFADAYRAWMFHGERSLAVYSSLELDEFASCASSLLNTPVYATDATLQRFHADLEGSAPR